MSDPYLPYGLPYYCEDNSEAERAEEDYLWADQYGTARPSDDPDAESYAEVEARCGVTQTGDEI